MNNKFRFILLASVLTITSCGTSSGSSESSSFIPPDPVSLEDAVRNTRSSYNIYFDSSVDDEYSYVEILSAKDYCYINDMIGYTVLDGDPDYMHMYNLTYGDSTVSLSMHGRVGGADDIRSVKSSQTSTFISLVDGFKDLFSVDPDNPWKYTATGYGMSRAFNQFFELKEFNFCNYYELEIGYDGRLSHFRAGEYYEDDMSDLFLAENFSIEEGGIANTWLYKDWTEKGSPVSTSIVNYKSFFYKNLKPYQCYESGEVEATVTAVDYDGSFYVANYDEYYGQVGVKVVMSDSCAYVPQVLDTVKVSGDIYMDTDTDDKDAFSPYFVNASVTKTGTSDYIPGYSEESLVDQYGAGVYAAYYLAGTPLYSQSSYSCYGYASDIPEAASEDGDTLVSMVCPAWTYDVDNTPMTMKLHLPKEYGTEKINSILTELRSFGDYGVDSSNVQLTYMANVIVYYSFEGADSNHPTVDLYAMPNSLISHRLSVAEMVEKEYGVGGFPEISGADSTVTFHFGDLAQYYLEYLYGIYDGKMTSGIFYNAAGVTTANVKKYFNSLTEDFGASFVDIYSCSLTSMYQHYVYQRDDLYVDVCLTIDGDDTYSVYAFIYRADKMVRSPSIEERIDESTGSFFSGSEFIKLEGTYDKDYHVYNLDNYAGNRFDKDSLLTIATLDITTDRYKELRDAYREAGWKQWREDITDTSSKAYSYVTRGVSHIVYYKANGNGKYTFLDFASYPTTDYTFMNHDYFDPRIEIAIYEGDEPMSTNYETDLTPFLEGSDMPENMLFEWKLPEGYKAEVYYTQDFSSREAFYDYGYTFGGDAFVYPDKKANLDACYEYIIKTFEDNGYVYSYTGKKGVCYEYTDDENYIYSFFYIMKDDRGFVRIIDSIGGADF